MSGLSPKQLEAVSGIAKGLTPSQIAKAVGISVRTLERWRKLPEFVAALSQIQSEASRQVKAELVKEVTSIHSRLDNLASKSLDCLEQVIDNPEARSGDRIAAAKIILGEWQRTQSTQTDELQAMKILVEAGYFPDDRLQKLQQALSALIEESREIFKYPVSLN